MCSRDRIDADVVCVRLNAVEYALAAEWVVGGCKMQMQTCISCIYAYLIVRWFIVQHDGFNVT